MYEAVDETKKSKIRRAIRLLDAYLNISGPHTYDIEAIRNYRPFNIPSSRFLRPVAKNLAALEGLRRRRIINGIKHAAINRQLFHLWWHPHNFGVNTDANIRFLESILSFYAGMNKKHGMKSLNMGELGELLAESA